MCFIFIVIASDHVLLYVILVPLLDAISDLQ